MQQNVEVFDNYQRKSKTYKTMLLIAMVSLFMMFAGLTSAYVVSKSRPDWLKDFEMPLAFYLSTITIVLSSVTFHLSSRAIKKDNRGLTSALLWITWVLGFVFVGLQFLGFQQIIDQGYFFTGEYSNVTTSFFYILVVLHLVHVFSGILWVSFVIYNHYKQKYNSSQPLGIELGAMFWHFLDFLWLYLFLFLYFIK